jgi:hypothetical protein
MDRRHVSQISDFQGYHMKERRKHTRRKPQKYLAVLDRVSGRQIGELANMSASGIMLITPEPVKSLTVLQCRVKLNRPILGREEINFDAECRWCRKNVQKNRWESGFALNVAGENHELVSYLSLSFALGVWETPRDADVETIPVENLRESTRYEPRETLPVFEQQSYREIGRLSNLSMRGVAFLTTKPVNKGSILHCRVKLPKTIFQRDFLLFDAECVWCKEIEGKNRYESGYRLQNISEHDSVIVLHLMIHHMDKQVTTQRYRVVR